MALVELKINGRIYKLSCSEDEKPNLLKIGEQLNIMATEIVANAGNVNENLLLLMLAVISKNESNQANSSNTRNNQDVSTILEQITQLTEKIEKS